MSAWNIVRFDRNTWITAQSTDDPQEALRLYEAEVLRFPHAEVELCGPDPKIARRNFALNK